MNPGDPEKKATNLPLERFSVQAGFVVFKKSQKASEMVYVEEGELEAFDDEKMLYNIPQGSLIGVSSVMDGTPFVYSVRAGKPAVLIRIGQKAMEQVLKQVPPWMLLTMKVLSQKAKDGKAALSKPIYASVLESFALFLATRAVNKPLDTAAVIREYMWQTRTEKEEVTIALKELIRRKFVKLEAGENGEQNAKMLLVKPKLFRILVEYLQAERKNETYPAYGLSKRERACLEFLGLENSLFTRSRDEWLKYLKIATPDADIIVIIKFLELGIFSEIPNTQKLFLETVVLDKYLSAIHGERNIRGLL